MAVPFVGHVVVLGYVATIVIAGLENAVIIGGLSALGATLYSIGVPKDGVRQYETAVKAEGFLVMAHGSPAEMARAKTILSAADPSRLDVAAGRVLSADCRNHSSLIAMLACHRRLGHKRPKRSTSNAATGLTSGNISCDYDPGNRAAWSPPIVPLFPETT